MTAPVAIEPRSLEAFMASMDQDMPEDIKKQVAIGLRRRFDNPPIDHLASCLGRAVTVEKVQSMRTCIQISQGQLMQGLVHALKSPWCRLASCSSIRMRRT
jgi:hypothetical protein